ncbi:ead/Ea22-like family protein [Salmonella enterica]|nr:ead/Ea22-like family protein [Salmonella enterica]EAZ1010838.1 ead/Ea22-like family protein [Salmonella enterica]EBK1504555.1 ead/Ea22-like family protein [Salmonella enterica subsp. enterica serovar Give]ECN1750807.1 ead/Ea22-like family protein [Salmonella enterica subsp. enterica serovar Give]
MSKIDYQVLRAKAEKATCGEWSLEYGESRFDGDDALIHREVAGYIPICRIEGAHPESGFDEDFQIEQQANAEFIAAANPATVLALLDELERNQQYIKRRDQENEDIALTVGKLRVELEAAKKRMTEQSAIVAAAEKLVRCKGRYHSELNYRALAKLFGVITPDLPPLVHENVHYADAAEVEITALRQRIAELEAKLETADKLQDSAFRDGLKAGFSYGQTDDQSGFAQCMSAYSTRAGIGVKQQEDSVDSDVGRNQPGMVVAVHIFAGDFVKVKGQVFEVEETDFDDHDVTLWFVGGNALKCEAGCPVEVVSAPVAAGIKVKGE